MKKIVSLLLVLYPLYLFAPNLIYETNGGQLGDHLLSLYNAYLLAQKYNLELVIEPFAHQELFACYDLFSQRPTNNYPVIQVTTEEDIVTHLGQDNSNFAINIRTEKIVPDEVTAQHAKQIIMPRSTIALDHLIMTKNDNELLVAVHIRKGNDNNNDGFVGKLSSLQIFDYNRLYTKYILTTDRFPLHYFDEPLRSRIIPWPEGTWPTKFPPEQFYIDQIRRIGISKKEKPIIVKLFTDDKDPHGLLQRLKKHAGLAHISFEYYDNRQKTIEERIIEDLYLMSQCDILVRSKSSFSIVAELWGNFATVIFPVNYIYYNNRLIMTLIVMRGEAI